MELHLGPVPSASVRMWVAYARNVLAQSLAGADDVPRLEPEVVERFEVWLDVWEQAAAAGPEMVWTGQADTEEVQYLAHSFFRVAERLAELAEERGYPISPPEGDDFYQTLVAGVIEGLAHEGRSMTDYAEGLRDTWPGLKDGEDHGA